MIRLCIAGKNNIAVESVDYLLREGLVGKRDCAICINKTEIGEDSFQRSLLKYSTERGIRVEPLENLFEHKSLIFVSLEYDRIIPIEKFSTKELFNIHFSLLPKYKGMYTSTWPILNGETESGVTLHKIDAGIDTGDVIDQISFKIDSEDTCRDLYLKYIRWGTELFKRNIGRLLSGTYELTPQSATGASYYSKNSIDYGNIKIDLRKTAFEVKSQIRAFNFREYQTPSVLGVPVVSAKILPTRSNRKPGVILTENNEFIDISTIDYDVRLYRP